MMAAFVISTATQTPDVDDHDLHCLWISCGLSCLSSDWIRFRKTVFCSRRVLIDILLGIHTAVLGVECREHKEIIGTNPGPLG